jgi:hypothetical protein
MILLLNRIHNFIFVLVKRDMSNLLLFIIIFSARYVKAKLDVFT